jgi:hypothetical protein
LRGRRVCERGSPGRGIVVVETLARREWAGVVGNVDAAGEGAGVTHVNVDGLFERLDLALDVFLEVLDWRGVSALRPM